MTFPTALLELGTTEELMEIRQGSSLYWLLTLTDDTGAAINLTGLSIAGRISSTLAGGGGAKLVDLTCALSGTPIDGTFTVRLTAVQTAALLAPATGRRIGYYEVDFYDSTERVTTLRGPVELTAEPVV